MFQSNIVDAYGGHVFYSIVTNITYLRRELSQSEIALNWPIRNKNSALTLTEKLILRKNCTEGPTFYVLKKLCHLNLIKLNYVCIYCIYCTYVLMFLCTYV